MKATLAAPIVPRPNLYGLDRETIAALLRDHGFPAFHAAQVFRWMYRVGRYDPEGWTDLPRPLRAALSREAAVNPGSRSARLEARDGTVKYRVRLPAGGEVEAVRMTQRGRITVCVSSQVGCAFGCEFCLTGKMGLARSLGPGEILGQVALVRDEGRLGSGPYNVVFMGMGEPLHNYDAVLGAFRILVDPDGFGLSWRRITVSTSGLAPAIERLAREPVRPRLAVSLNATTDAVRDAIMPVNRRYPLARLSEACRAWWKATGETFTFEYTLIAGRNDGDADVSRLARFVRRHPAKLNLIPFNPVPGWLADRPPDRERVLAIRDRLLALGVPVSVRFSRGLEARAACGQLALLPDTGPGGDAPARAGPLRPRRRIP